MGILGFLLTSFIIWLLFLLLKAGWRIYRTYKNINNAFRQGPFGPQQQRQESQDESRGSSGSSWFTWGKRQSSQKSKGSKKIIPEDYGEYVDFTESKSSEPTEVQRPESTDRYKKESQIEDAEWEEIK